MHPDDFLPFLHDRGVAHFRAMPWRDDTRPYYILVSEIMLQQTQVDRVIPKFLAFIAAFPDESSLAAAPLADVLRLWSGLGYNRRARYLHESAKYVTTHNDGTFPATQDELMKLPGVGGNTAGAIMAYAYNHYVPFVETNIRTVYFHHFFTPNTTVDDKRIIELLNQTADKTHPRKFYWALMDYGSHLKRQGYGRIAQSKHYKKQSPLAGSVREIRGQIISALASGKKSHDELTQAVTYDSRFDAALNGLLADKLVKNSTDVYHLSD